MTTMKHSDPQGPDDTPWPATCVTKTLWPPQAGTLGLKQRYGAALVCVRYRLDREQQRRYTTVELVVDEGQVRAYRSGGAKRRAPAAATEQPAAPNGHRP